LQWDSSPKGLKIFDYISKEENNIVDNISDHTDSVRSTIIDDYMVYYNLGNAYYKTKQYTKAEKYARLAIKKGKDAKEKTEATEELLQKINDEMKKK